MAKKRFNSKVDRWIMLVLVVAILIDLAVIVVIALQPTEPLAATAAILICLLTIALIASVLVGTHYTVDRDVLKVACGPFRRKVSIDQISSVEATRNPRSSPALSLDRLRIRYGNNRSIMISPADRPGLLRAIGKELET